jgi:hypothetical protein
MMMMMMMMMMTELAINFSLFVARAAQENTLLWTLAIFQCSITTWCTSSIQVLAVSNQVPTS